MNGKGKIINIEEHRYTKIDIGDGQSLVFPKSMNVELLGYIPKRKRNQGLPESKQSIETGS